MLHNSRYSVSGIGQREQFISYKPGVSAFFQMTENFLIVNFTGAWFMASRGIRRVDMTELVYVAADRITDTSLINLHVINVI